MSIARSYFKMISSLSWRFSLPHPLTFIAYEQSDPNFFLVFLYPPPFKREIIFECPLSNEIVIFFTSLPICYTPILSQESFFKFLSSKKMSGRKSNEPTHETLQAELRLLQSQLATAATQADKVQHHASQQQQMQENCEPFITNGSGPTK